MLFLLSCTDAVFSMMMLKISLKHQIFQLGVVFSPILMAIAAQAVPVQTHVERVVSHLVGVMDTTKQADNNPKAPSVRMTTCRVQMVEVPEMVYLYQEQALTKNLDHPYRQRILQIKPSEDGQTVISESFKVINAEQLIGLCNQPETSRKLTLETLDKSVCSVFLKPKDNGYIGNTPPEGCPANVRGALTITNTILLHETGMDTWDRGLDENGNQVWGARKDSYQYRWVQ